MPFFGAVPYVTGSAVTVRRETTPRGRPLKKTSSAWTAASPPATLPGVVAFPQTPLSVFFRDCATPQAPTTVVRLETKVASGVVAFISVTRAVFAAARFAGADAPTAVSAADRASGLITTV